MLWPHRMACGVLVPDQGWNPRALRCTRRVLGHGASMEVPELSFWMLDLLASPPGVSFSSPVFCLGVWLYFMGISLIFTFWPLYSVFTSSYPVLISWMHHLISLSVVFGSFWFVFFSLHSLFLSRRSFLLFGLFLRSLVTLGCLLSN